MDFDTSIITVEFVVQDDWFRIGDLLYRVHDTRTVDGLTYIWFFNPENPADTRDTMLMIMPKTTAFKIHNQK